MTDFHLSYVDFAPQCTKPAGVFSLPEFERFDILVARANDWLGQNSTVKIRSCESVDCAYRPVSSDNIGKFSTEDVNTDFSLMYELGNAPMGYIRTLRLWIEPKATGDDPAPVRLGYYNIVPACIDAGGIFSIPKFERFDETLSKINELFKQQPLQGKIINIETTEMKFQAWGGGVDPDINFWHEPGKAATCYLNCLRLFYAGGPPAMETIGCVDIVPNVTGSGRSLTGEPLSVLNQRANAWIQQYPNLHITNIQSINYKVSLSFWSAQVRGVDTMNSFYYKAGKGGTVFCRIIRICYTTSPNDSAYPGGGPPVVSYRTFTPALIRPPGSMLAFNPKYEGISQNMTRLTAWLAHTRARVLSVETTRHVFWMRNVDPEQTVTFDSGSMTDVWLTVLRIYLEGQYTDPPLEALPAAPTMEEPMSIGCCAMCSIL